MNIKSKVKLLLKTKTNIDVNLGCGDNIITGFINLDMKDGPGVDVVWNLEEFPWPFPSDSIDLLIASQLVEHINPHGGTFIKWMDEAWRVLKSGGQLMIATPYGASDAYIQDPSHCNPCNEKTWCYFDPFDEMTGGLLYQNYKPKPWKIMESSWYSQGNMEIILEKRPDDPSYHNIEITKNKTLIVLKPEWGSHKK